MHLQVTQQGRPAQQYTRISHNKDKEKGKKTSPCEGVGGWVQRPWGNLCIIFVSECSEQNPWDFPLLRPERQ